MKVLSKKEQAMLKGGVNRNYIHTQQSHIYAGNYAYSGQTNGEQIGWCHDTTIGLCSVIVGPLICGTDYADK